MRVLVQICKKPTDNCLGSPAGHRGKLAGLVDPAVSIYEGWRNNFYTDQGNQVLVDCGPKSITAFVMEGHLVFFRSHRPGMDELTEAIMELRGVDFENAERLVRKLSSNPPEDIVDLIKHQSYSIAAAIQNNVRFAKSH